MPRNAALIAAVAGLVVAGAFALHLLSPPPVAPAAAPDEASSQGRPSEQVAAALCDLTERLDRLENEVFQPRLAPTDPSERLADLEKRLRSLEERPQPPQAAPPPTSGDTAAQAAQPVEVDLASFSDEDLLAKARGLAGAQARRAALPLWLEVLERGTTDEIFVEANLEIGYAYRKAQDHVKEEEAFREALRVAGPDSERGQAANYQIAWSQHFRGDNASARETMAEVAASRATARSTTGHARLYVAHFSLELNDRERAREALQSVVHDFGDSAVPMEAWLANRAKEMLAKIP